ncbi:hypothetical protein BBF93_04565 [Hyphomonas sp. CACIAM 19H1]|nr:hypothetical protein BBF93_04565 [Hyphomonas sp. CACIAM 19H1]
MPQSIFFSWQSDTSPTTGRNFVRKSLEKAVQKLAQDADLFLPDREMEIDSDTSGVPGSPPIVETIFSKIDKATAFVADLTYVGTRTKDRLMPNPNVTLEYGWAFKALGSKRILSVMNVAHGHPEAHPLPFDLQHLRRPILFDLPDDADEAARAAERDKLVKALFSALKLILVLGAPQSKDADPHPHDVELLARVRAQLSDALVRFLRDHNFGTPFHSDILDPIGEMAQGWRGARYEFHDANLQASFAEVIAKSTDLMNVVSVRTYLSRGNSKVSTAKTDEDLDIGIQPETFQAIAEMNQLARALASAIDVFERMARDRVRVAGPAPPDTDLSADASQLIENLASHEGRGEVPAIVVRPKVIVRLAPHEATKGQRLDPKRVVQAMLGVPPLPDIAVSSGSDEQQWWSCDPPRGVDGKPNGESRWLARLVRPGTVELQATIGERIDDDPEIAVDGRDLERLIVSSIERAGSVLKALDLSGPTTISISLMGVEDVILTRARPGGRKIVKPYIQLPVTTAPSLIKGVGSALQEQFDILWQSSGWADGSPSFQSGTWHAGGDRLHGGPS